MIKKSDQQILNHIEVYCKNEIYFTFYQIDIFWQEEDPDTLSKKIRLKAVQPNCIVELLENV